MSRLPLGWDDSVHPFGPEGNFWLIGCCRPPNAVDGGCFLGMLCWEAEAEVIGVACCSHAMGPVSHRLIGCGNVAGSSVVSVGGGGRTSIECRVWGMAVTFLGCMLLRSTAISCSLLAGSLGVAASQRENSLKVNWEASIWLLDTLPGPYTVAAYAHGRWWGLLWGSVEGVPSIMALMWPMLDRGARDRTSSN